MRWKWILGIAAFFVIAVIVAICAILLSYDFNYFKPQIARMVKDATGRELSLGGDLELKIGLTPALVIEDVSFQNVQWGSRPELAKIRRLEVQVAVLPLIRRIIHVKRLILVEPDILIETNRAGKANLEFKTVKKRKVAKTVEKAPNQVKLILSALIFNKIRIENGRLTYKDGRSGKTFTVTLERATATAGTDSPVALNLKGEYNNKPFQIKAILGALAALTDPDKAWLVKLTSNIAGSTVTIDGAIRDPIQGKGLAITVTGKGRSIPEILKLFNITRVPELGPFDVTGKLTDLDGKPGVEDLDLKVGSEDVASARFTGAIKDLIKGKGLAITVTGKGRSVPEILKLFNITRVPELGPFDVTGKLTDLDGKLGVKDLDLSVGSEDMASARFTGAIKDLIKGKGLAITVTGKGRSIPEILKLFNITRVPELGPFDVTGKLTDLDGKLGVKDLDLSVGSEDMASARFTGAIKDLIKGKGLAITVTGKGRSIPEILKLFNITSVPELGPFDVTGKLTDLDGKLGVEDLDLKVGSEDMASARFTGAVEDLMTIKGMNFGFDIQGKDLANLEKITSKPMPFKGPFSISGNAAVLSEKDFKISELKALIQESDLNGSLEINLAGEKPWIAADLSSQKLDLRPLLPKKESQAGKPEKDSNESPARKGKVFSDTPLSLEVLKQVDAKIELKAEQLLLPRLSLSDTTAHMVLKDGHLTVEPINCVQGGGTLDGRFELNLQGKTAAVAVDLEIEQFDLGGMLEEMGVNDLLQGNMDIKLDLKGRGNSIAGLMAGLNGKTMLVMGDGNINKKAIKLLGTDLSFGLLRLLNPFKKEEEYAKINCFVSGFDIKDGLAQNTALVMNTSQVIVVGYGNIDLKTEKIDLSLKPSPKKGVGVKGLAKFSLSFGEFTKSFKFQGTLAKPSMAIDPTGSIVTLGKAIGGVALFGPFGIAAALADGKFGDKNPCLAAIEATKKDADDKKSEEKEGVIEKTTKP